jgi:hypothetical protein
MAQFLGKGAVVVVPKKFRIRDLEAPPLSPQHTPAGVLGGKGSIIRNGCSHDRSP